MPAAFLPIGLKLSNIAHHTVPSTSNSCDKLHLCGMISKFAPFRFTYGARRVSYKRYQKQAIALRVERGQAILRDEKGECGVSALHVMKEHGERTFRVGHACVGNSAGDQTCLQKDVLRSLVTVGELRVSHNGGPPETINRK